MNLFIKIVKLILEGETIKDKGVLFCYFLFNAPINFLNKHHKNHKLLRNVTIKSKDGIFFCGNNIFTVGTGSSTYEPETKKYFELNEGTFIDIGANIGAYTVLVGRELKDKGKVITIEPMPGNFEILKKNIELNNLNNIIPLQIALGDKEEKADFYLDNEGKGGGAHSLVKESPYVTTNKITVNVRKLDNIVKELKINRIDLIKIDVEGGEADVLKGSINTLKKFHPKIIVEAWNESYLSKIKKILEPLGYKIKKIDTVNYLATIN